MFIFSNYVDYGLYQLMQNGDRIHDLRNEIRGNSEDLYAVRLFEGRHSLNLCRNDEHFVPVSSQELCIFVSKNSLDILGEPWGRKIRAHYANSHFSTLFMKV